MEKYYNEFEETEENKLSYMDIFKEYVSSFFYSQHTQCQHHPQDIQRIKYFDLLIAWQKCCNSTIFTCSIFETVDTDL